MTRLSRNILGALAAVTLIAAGAAAQERQSRERGDFDRRSQRSDAREPDAFTARYGSLIVENNIFLRDRRPPREAPVTQTTRPAPPPPQPEKDWMLVGIVFEQGTFRAYFENIRDSGVTRALPGEAIARGRVTDVFIDAVGFEMDGQTTWVEIGQDLTGAPVAVAQAAPRQVTPGSRPAAAPTGAEAAAPDGSGLSVEERLRLRRLQEAGRPAGQPGGDTTGAVPVQGEPIRRELPPGFPPPDPGDPDNLQRIPPPDPGDPDDPDTPQRVPPPDPDDPDAP